MVDQIRAMSNKTHESYIDLELDLVRQENGRVEVLDRDEFDTACREGWISPDDAQTAKASCRGTAGKASRHFLDAAVAPPGQRVLQNCVKLLVCTVGAVYDRAYLLHSRKGARS